MKIATCKLRAASKFMAKGDVRSYLCGIRINSKFIEATNGHIAVRMDSDVKTKRDVIVRLAGRIPAKSVETELCFSKDKNTAYHYDGFKQVIGVQLFEVEDGKFPDLNKVIPEKFTIGKYPLINAMYQKVFYDAFADKKDDQFGVKAVSYDTNEKLICNLTGIKNYIYGNPTIVIMAMREDD